MPSSRYYGLLNLSSGSSRILVDETFAADESPGQSLVDSYDRADRGHAGSTAHSPNSETTESHADLVPETPYDDGFSPLQSLPVQYAVSSGQATESRTSPVPSGSNSGIEGVLPRRKASDESSMPRKRRRVSGARAAYTPPPRSSESIDIPARSPLRPMGLYATQSSPSVARPRRDPPRSPAQAPSTPLAAVTEEDALDGQISAESWESFFRGGTPSRASKGVFPDGLRREVLYFGQAEFAWQRERYYRECFPDLSSERAYKTARKERAAYTAEQASILGAELSAARQAAKGKKGREKRARSSARALELEADGEFRSQLSKVKRKMEREWEEAHPDWERRVKNFASSR